MISDEDFRFLLKESHYAKKILEIGTGTGKSTTALISNRAEVHTIDKDDIFEYIGIEDKIHGYHCTSTDYWKLYDVRDFDFVFVDGSIGVYDCEEILKRTTDNFKIVFHDYLPNEIKYPGKNKGWYNMKVFKETSLLDYDITTKTGGTHCVLAELKKDK
jgi:predicted O-methyltransferase YrrM